MMRRWPLPPIPQWYGLDGLGDPPPPHLWSCGLWCVAGRLKEREQKREPREKKKRKREGEGNRKRTKREEAKKSANAYRKSLKKRRETQ